MQARPVRFVGVSFALLNADEVEADIRQRSRSAEFSYIVTPNSDHIVKLAGKGVTRHRHAFAQAYDRAALRLCDSQVVRGLARLRGLRLPLVTGSGLTERLFSGGLGQGDRIAIIGGDRPLLEKLRELFPGPEYHQHIPPMGVLNDEAALAEIAAFVRATRPNYSFFAFGAPQSEIAAMRCAQTEGATGVGLCIGASLAFITGDIKRAPKFLQAMGLEWAFRLLSEPRRLWRRYLVESPKVIMLACRSPIEK